VIEIEHWHQHTPSRAWTTGQSVGWACCCASSGTACFSLV